MERIGDQVKEVPLTRGLVALVDAEDYPNVSRFKWHARAKGGRFYAGRIDRTGGRLHLVFLHAEIMGPGADHKNRDALDCRRSNLRRCTQQQNCFNRSKSANKSSRYRGVSRVCGGWRSYIRHNGILHNLGLFREEDMAARTYDEAARRLFGEFANPNFQ